MHADVVDLRDFYATGLGQLARRTIRRRIREFWPDVTGQNVLGLGYATPYLRAFQSEAERVIALMPAAQGVLPWPPEGPNVVALAEETDLPLPDLSIDRVLVIHALEATEHLRLLMREVWRVLAGGGRLLVVVPNRRGIWARTDRTPFGHGHPYTRSQLSRLLRETLFTPVQGTAALYAPPYASRMLVGSGRAWERIGARWFTTFGGVVMIEATKQIYAGHVARARPQRRAIVVPMPQARARAAERRKL
jgi:SAM-dependent methyltransferase